MLRRRVAHLGDRHVVLGAGPVPFGAGQGDWKSTEWVADAVKINFSLVLKPKP